MISQESNAKGRCSAVHESFNTQQPRHTHIERLLFCLQTKNSSKHRANCGNPCPCGYFGDDRKEYSCSMSMVQCCQKRISGPIMDRSDLHVEMKRVPFQKLADLEGGEPSEVIRQRVEAVRQIQEERFANLECL
ncbi:MAG: ATP-binding protein [Chloroflexota bacterium]